MLYFYYFKDFELKPLCVIPTSEELDYTKYESQGLLCSWLKTFNTESKPSCFFGHFFPRLMLKTWLSWSLLMQKNKTKKNNISPQDLDRAEPLNTTICWDPLWFLSCFGWWPPLKQEYALDLFNHTKCKYRVTESKIRKRHMDLIDLKSFLLTPPPSTSTIKFKDLWLDLSILHIPQVFLLTFWP